MRTSEADNVHLALFCGDVEGGDCLIQCSHCNEEILCSDLIERVGEQEFCPKCDVELFYRPWWEW